MEDGRRRAKHDYWWILNEQFGPAWSASTAWEFLISQVLLRGDRIRAEAARFDGMASRLWPFDDDQTA